MSDAAFVFVVSFCCRKFEMMRGRGRRLFLHPDSIVREQQAGYQLNSA